MKIGRFMYPESILVRMDDVQGMLRNGEQVPFVPQTALEDFEAALFFEFTRQCYVIDAAN